MLFITSRSRFLLLAAIMALVSIVVIIVMLLTLREQAIAREGERLSAVAGNYARLLSTFHQWETAEHILSPEEGIRQLIRFVEESHNGWHEGLGVSGEVVLGRRQGEELLLLFHGQRGTAHAPLTIPWGSRDLAQPMHRALEGKRGVIVAPDYRGVDVHAAYEFIPALEIGLVVKIDSSELHAPSYQAVRNAIVVSSALILVGALLFVQVGEAAIRRAREAEGRLVVAMNRLNREKERASQLLALQQRAHELGEEELSCQALDLAVQLTDSRIGYLHTLHDDQKSVVQMRWNAAARKACVVAQHVHDAIDQAGVWADSIRLKQPVVHNDLALLNNRKGYPEGHVEVKRHVSVPMLEGSRVMLVIGVGNKEAPYDEDDIQQLQQVAAGIQKILAHQKLLGQLKQNEESLQRVNRALTAISMASKALLRSTDEQVFMDDVCRLVVEQAGYRMVWIGLLRPDADRSVEPVACFGFKGCRLESLRTFWEKLEHVHGPTGSAIRPGRPRLSRYLQTDPAFSAWKAQALACGYASSLSIPLTINEELIGTLNVCASEPDAFDEEELRFLTELTNHVSLGIHSFRQEMHAQRLLAAMEQTKDIILISDQHGQVQYANQAFLALIGKRFDEIMGQEVLAVWPSQSIQEVMDQALQTVRQGQTWRGRLHQHEQGGFLEATLSPVKDAEGTIVSHVGVYRDITQQVQMEAQLRQAHKMEAVGTLAGGIAHDFNNILGVIIGYSELVLAKLAPGGQEHQDLQEVLTASLRARDLVAQLLAFSRQTDWESSTLDLVPLIKEVARFLRAVTPANVKLTISLQEENFVLLSHPHQIHQILMNLCTNAVHAVQKRDGGEVEIVLREAVFPDPDGRSPLFSSGRHVLLTVRDNGEGIPEHHLERIFDPFFTTKGVGEGTGLGLSVVHGHVSALRGQILVESRVGSGTTFLVYLPLEEPVGERRKNVRHGEESSRLGLRVLLVDDEVQLTQVLAGHLVALGCQAVSASSAAEGLALLDANPSGFDLVITDQTMPDATGEQFLRALRQREPDLPVVLTSGYQLPFPQQELRTRGFFAFLSKPVLALDLARLLRRLPIS